MIWRRFYYDIRRYRSSKDVLWYGGGSIRIYGGTGVLRMYYDMEEVLLGYTEVQEF